MRVIAVPVAVALMPLLSSCLSTGDSLFDSLVAEPKESTSTSSSELVFYENAAEEILDNFRFRLAIKDHRISYFEITNNTGSVARIHVDEFSLVYPSRISEKLDIVLTDEFIPPDARVTGYSDQLIVDPFGIDKDFAYKHGLAKDLDEIRLYFSVTIYGEKRYYDILFVRRPESGVNESSKVEGVGPKGK